MKNEIRKNEICKSKKWFLKNEILKTLSVFSRIAISITNLNYSRKFKKLFP